MHFLGCIALFQMLTGRMWLVDTLLASTNREHSLFTRDGKCPWTALLLNAEKKVTQTLCPEVQGCVSWKRSPKLSYCLLSLQGPSQSWVVHG